MTNIKRQCKPYAGEKERERETEVFFSKCLCSSEKRGTSFVKHIVKITNAPFKRKNPLQNAFLSSCLYSFLNT